MKIRLWPEYLHPASELYRFRWPKNELCHYYASLCRDNGREIAWFRTEYLQYLPHHRVSLYVRMGIIARVVVSGELSEVNSEIQQNWFREGNTEKCLIVLREHIPSHEKQITQADIDASAHEFNWARRPDSKGTGIILGDDPSPSSVRRLMRMELAPGKHTQQEWRQVMQRDGWKCLRCGSTKRLTKDHIVPIAKGGSNDASNLQTLCLSCNASKGARHIDYRTNLGLMGEARG